MASPSISRRRVGVVASGFAIAVLLATGTLVVGFDHPIAELGLTGTPGTAFTTVDARHDTYTEQLVHRIERATGTYSTTLTATHFANGTVIRTMATDDAPWARRNRSMRAQVRINGTAYEMARYRPGSVPEEPTGEHVIVEENTVYERIPASHVNDFGVANRSVIPRFHYARDGTVSRRGDRLVRYEVVGHDGGKPSVLENRATGYLLVSPESETIRYAHLTGSTDRGRWTIEYTSTTRATESVPAWVSTARTIPPRDADGEA